MYGSDDYLKLIYAHRERLERYFLLLLNDPDVADALLAKDRFQAFARGARAAGAALRSRWDGASRERAPSGPVRGEALQQGGLAPIRRCASASSHDAKALVFASGARPPPTRTVLALFHDQLTFQQYVRGDDRSIWSFHGFADEKRRGARLVRRPQAPHLSRRSPAKAPSSSSRTTTSSPRSAARSRARLPLKGIFKMDFKQRRSDRPLVPARDQRALQPVALPRRVQRREPAARRLRLPARRRAPAADRALRHALPLALARARLPRLPRAQARGELNAARGSRRSSSRATSTTSSRGAIPGPGSLLDAQRSTRLRSCAPGRLLNRLRQWRSTAS